MDEENRRFSSGTASVARHCDMVDPALAGFSLYYMTI
jgi:hypothetical protein